MFSSLDRAAVENIFRLKPMTNRLCLCSQAPRQKAKKRPLGPQAHAEVKKNRSSGGKQHEPNRL